MWDEFVYETVDYINNPAIAIATTFGCLKQALPAYN